MRGEHLDGSLAGKIRIKEQAMINLELMKERERQKEELVKQGKMRKIITRIGDKTTIVKYEPVK